MKIKVFQHANYCCGECFHPYIPTRVGTQLIYKHILIKPQECPQADTSFIVKLNVEELDSF